MRLPEVVSPAGRFSSFIAVRMGLPQPWGFAHELSRSVQRPPRRHRTVVIVKTKTHLDAVANGFLSAVDDDGSLAKKATHQTALFAGRQFSAEGAKDGAAPVEQEQGQCAGTINSVGI
jgi:hypothetical protein